MNYDYFSRLEAGTLTISETETEQAFMEKVLSAVFSEKDEVLARQINDLMAPQFCNCSAEERSMAVTFVAQEWMLNPNGTLHGGMLSTAVDMVMSVLGRYLAKKRTMVTAQLSMNFMRAIQNAEYFTVSVTADHVGRRSVMLHATVTATDSGTMVATATGMLM